MRHQFTFSALILLLATTHLVEVLLWAGALMAVGAMRIFRDAFYYTSVTYTTLGYAENTASAPMAHPRADDGDVGRIRVRVDDQRAVRDRELAGSAGARSRSASALARTRSAGRAASSPSELRPASSALPRRCVNVISPPVAPTLTVSPGANLPARISFASGFSICCWIARFSGRAP